MPVLEVKNLKTYFKAEAGVSRAVDGVSFEIERGETFALVGESGCGKSVTAMSIIQLIQDSGFHPDGKILLNGRDVIRLGEREKRDIRGNKISMIFQEPMTSLNPVFTVGDQILEAITLHQKKSAAEARAIAVDMLRRVKFTDPEAALSEYPHRLSGGMRQRVMIAIALCCRPDVLIADEPTTALDVTIQDEIIKLIKELKDSLGTAVLLITHNLALVYNNADTVGVMYAGKIVELAASGEFFKRPLHPYSIKLLSSIPGRARRGAELDTISGSVPPATAYVDGCRFSGRCPREMRGCESIEPRFLNAGDGHFAACHLYDEDFMSMPASAPLHREAGARPVITMSVESGGPLVRVSNLKTYYPIRKGILKRIAGHVKAVDGIDLVVKKGSTLALVGESGSGKTTAGKTVIRLIEPTEGQIFFNGADVTRLDRAGLREFRSKAQIIFQDPYSSLNPRLTVGRIIEEGLLTLMPGLDASARFNKAVHALGRVGLDSGAMERYPHEFSGGQRQRIGIARALAVDPEFIVCDEAVSALDVSVQAQILNLLKSIQRESGLSFLFITHDLGVVEYMADEVAVMYNGRIVEQAATEELFSSPRHAYTKKLLAAVPRMNGGV